MPQRNETDEQGISGNQDDMNTKKEDYIMKKMNVRKQLLSLGAAALMCVSAVAGFGSAACAKQVPNINAGITAVNAQEMTKEITKDNTKGITSGKTNTAGEVDPMEALMEMIFGEGSGYSSGDDSVGNMVSFKTTDLDGNSVKSEDLFRGKKVTMINFWATWCPHCVEELPELEKLNAELAAQGCQVIGICEDADTEAEEAKRILNENGVTYTNVALVKEMYPMMPHKALPTTYFVDSEGKILTKPVVGVSIDQYKEKLAECGVNLSE